MLQEIRLKKGLSQNQLARSCNIPLSTITKYEGGFANINNAKLETLLKLCLVLECRIEDIIDNDDLKTLLEKYEGARK